MGHSRVAVWGGLLDDDLRWLVPRNPGLWEAAPLGLKSDANDNADSGKFGD